MPGIDHDGSYNPWDELNDPKVKAIYDAAVATGGFAFRTGVCVVIPGKVTVLDDFTSTSEPPTFRYYGDGLHIVSFETPVHAPIG